MPRNFRYKEGELQVGEFRREIFATPIFTANCGNDEISKLATKLAYKFRDTSDDEEGMVSDQWNVKGKSKDRKEWDKHGVTSFYSRNLKREKEWNPISSELIKISRQLIREEAYQEGLFGNKKLPYEEFANTLFISNMWTTIYPEGAYVPMHIHSNFRWSGVFYAKAKEDCGAITFQDPAWVSKTMTQGVTPRLNPYYTSFSLKVSEGDLIIFPAWLPHRSLENKSGEDRIIVSFNMNFGEELRDFSMLNDIGESNVG